MAEEKTDKKDEKQVPEKPKKGGGGGGVSMLMLIGTIAGTVVLMVIIMSAAFYFFVMPDLSAGHGADSTDTEHVKIKERDDGGSKDHEMDMLEEEDVVMGEKGSHLIETGKIVANPNGSSKFAVLNLALDFRVSEKDERFPEGASITLEDPVIHKLLIIIKDRLNSRVGGLTVDDLNSIGSDSLRSLIKEDLKPIFKQNRIFLRNVYLSEFLIQ